MTFGFPGMRTTYLVGFCALILCLGGSLSGPAAAVGRVPTTQNSDAEQLLRKAFALSQQGRLDEALANLTEFAALNPKDSRPHALAGLIYWKQRKLKNASDEFETAIRLNPSDKRLYLYKGQVDRLRNANGEALRTYQQALNVDPNFAEVYASIGEILSWDEKRRSEAIAAYQKAIKLDPQLLVAYEGLGKVFEQEKKYKEAEDVLRLGMAADHVRMSGRFTLGRMLVKQGRLKEARALWEGRTSDKDDTLPQLITVLRRAENLQVATDALTRNPKDPSALIEMGLAVMEGDSWVVDGRQKRAMEYFRQALEIDPANTRAQYAIVKAYIQIADVLKDENKNVDIELTKLKQLDPKLAAEMDEYRRTYQGGIRISKPQ